MIEFRSICTTAGLFQLRNVDVIIPPTECHVIVGPTGAGKTVLLETLIGLRPLTSGTIIVNGKDIAGLPPNQRHISYVPQDTCLFPNMTIRENIMYGVRVRGISPADVMQFIEHLISFFQIGPLLERYPKNLSGGEKQRVALVRALAPKPVMLVLDEPFSAIDHSMREEIRRLIKEILEEFKTTTLIVTHDLDEAYFLGNALSILIDGRIVQTGNRDDVYYYPKTFAVASFLGIKNIFHGRVEEILPEQILMHWEDLDTRLTVSCRCSHKRFKVGQEVRFGIRPESVYILRPQNHSETKSCVFPGIVKKLYRRGKMHTVLVELGESKKIPIEIDIHDAAARKVGIVEGGSLEINMNPKWVFILSD
ncbi:MAG: ABC transporter ATP-binding protein [Candidatus Ozemobacteraceae bacterium]